MAQKFSETHQFQYYECDTTQSVTLPMLMSIFIKTSEAQTEALGVGEEYIHSLGLGWVITNYEIQINRLPKTGETMTVTTEATAYNKYFCYRNFWLHDEQGHQCVFVESTFVLMDLVKRKMSSVPEAVIAPYECEKITKIKRGTKIDPLSEAAQERVYRVRFSDIDGNHHVNNARYFEWMTDVLGYDFLVEYEPTQIAIRFDKEVEYGQEINSWWEVQKAAATAKTIHEIRGSDQTFAHAQIDWQKRAQ